MAHKRMITTFFILVLVVIVIILFRINYTRNFEKNINLLYSNLINATENSFSYSQLEELPQPVQKYFKLAIPANQPYIRCVRLKHVGQFKTAPDKPSKDIIGEQYFITSSPGFIWKGKLGPVTAQDMYLVDKGKLSVSLLETFPIMKTEGETVDQGELLRWLGESVWFPTNLLPNDQLEWEPIDSATAKLIYNHNNLSIYFIVSFNEKGEITQLQTERYYKGKNLVTWIGHCSGYKMIHGFTIPTEIKATWKLNTGDHTYANFKLTEIEYDIPEKFK
jgi:hypothetical protein